MIDINISKSKNKEAEKKEQNELEVVSYDNTEFKNDLFSFLDSCDEYNYEEDSKDNEISNEINNKNNSFQSVFNINNKQNFENNINDPLHKNCPIINSVIKFNQRKKDNKSKESKINQNEGIDINIIFQNDIFEYKAKSKDDKNINNDSNNKLKMEEEINTGIFNINKGNEKICQKRNRLYLEKDKCQNNEKLYMDVYNKKEESYKNKYIEVPKLIKIKNKTYHSLNWFLCFPNILLDKYVLAFSLMIDRKYPPVIKFLVYRGKKDTFALIKLNHEIYLTENSKRKSVFNFGEYIPDIKCGKSWRYLINGNFKGNIDDYFTNIDTKNAFSKKRMRQNMFFNKDPKDKEEISFYDIRKINKIKKALDHVKNIVAQKKCDYNKKCFWITCDKNIDLNCLYELNNEDIYIQNIDYSFENYCNQKTVIKILKENFSKEFYSFLKIWTANEKICLSNGIYDIVPVHDKVIIFSYYPIQEYFKEDSFNKFSINNLFKQYIFKSGIDIKRFIEEIKDNF